MLITDKPEELEQRANELDQQATAAATAGRPRSAEVFRQRAARLRQQATELRSRRTDGVRFG